MKRLISLFCCLCLFIPTFAQTTFQELTLKDALEKAKTENKYVFVDCYTSWCGSCKLMTENVFPSKTVGNYMNNKFVCVKFDMEKEEGIDIQQKYQIMSYPTFLVLKTDGTLLSRIVGAILDEDKFIKRVDSVFMENSVIQLEGEYMAGNRKMDFLLRYIKALLASENTTKAKSIALDVITSLEDKQKCTAPYWFIYEDYRLSPVGSGNLAYLLKHVEQFRQGIGVERVDKKLGILFALQLESILRGANKNITLQEVGKLKVTLDTFKLTGQDYLYGYIDLINGIMTGNTGVSLESYKRVFPFVADEKIATFYFMPIMYFKDKWSVEQKKELAVLTDQLIKKVQLPELKSSLYEIKTNILTK